MTLLIFSSSQEVLRAARAKWHQPRFPGYEMESALSQPSVVIWDWVKSLRFVVGKGNARYLATLAAPHCN